MFPVGGVGVMLAIIAVTAVLCGVLAAGLRRPMGAPWAVSAALLVWSLTVIGAVTLIPAHGAPGIVPAAAHETSCSWDVGGPAPDGFWIFPGGQRLLNSAIFAPAGALLVLVSARWRWVWLLVPAGLVGLAAYSVGIELTQLVLARIDRACDVTDVIDNVRGAVAGAGLGLLSLPVVRVVRPWPGVRRRGASGRMPRRRTAR